MTRIEIARKIYEPHENHLETKVSKYDPCWAKARIMEIFGTLCQEDQEELLESLRESVEVREEGLEKDYPLFFVTEIERKVYDYVRLREENGEGRPTFKQIAEEVGYKNPSGARRAAIRLANQGVLYLEVGARGVKTRVESKQVCIKHD